MDASSPSSCDPLPGLETVLCDRFERTLAVDERMYQSHTASPSVVREGEGYALEITAGSVQEWLDRRVEGTVSHATLAYDLNILEWPSAGSRQVAPLRMRRDSGEEVSVFLILHAGPPPRMALVEHRNGDQAGEAEHSFEAPGEGYHRYRIEVDLVAGRAWLAVDGIDQLPAAEPFPQLVDYGAADRVSLLLGAAYGTDTAPVTLRFRDVVLALDSGSP